MNVRFYGKLIDQYKKYGKLIIAVDFDDTVFPYSGDVDCGILRSCQDCVRKANAQGHDVILFTCRDDQRIPSQYFHFNEMRYDYFNESPVKDIDTGLGKIYYNILLDDKAGLLESLSTLQQVLLTIEEMKEEK